MYKQKYMQIALKEAYKAEKKQDIPVGCVIVCDNKIVSVSHNKKERKQNALYHAEVLAINKACKKLKSFRLTNCEMYITLEPCLMCVGAILSARVKKVYFGAFDKKFGAGEMLTNNKFNHKTQFEGGICEKECAKLLTDFFKKLRKK